MNTRYDFSNPATNQTSRLRPHPLNVEVYGDSKPDAALLSSIRQHGILNPLVINRQKEILSGTRRWLAAQELGLTSVPVITLLSGVNAKDTTPANQRDILLSELFLVESNKAREKTESQKDAEAAALLRIESELAKARQKGMPKLAEPNSAGRAIDKVAKITGEAPETVRKRAAIHAANIPAETRDKVRTDAAFKKLPEEMKRQEARRRNGFLKTYPEHTGKSDADIDALIQQTYGTPTVLRKHHLHQKLDVAIEHAELEAPSLPLNKEPVHKSQLEELRNACSVLNNNDAVAQWALTQTTADIPTRMGRFDFHLVGLRSSAIKKVLDALA